MTRPLAGRDVLVITPDFPPARGGIQILSHRIVSAFATLRPRVVTLGHPSAAGFDREQPFDVARVPTGPRTRQLALVELNGLALASAARRRPAVVLSTHIVGGPAAALLRARMGVPFVQYVHAKELAPRPGLARLGLTRADRVVVVSRYAAELAAGSGAPPGRLTMVHPGVDLPAAVTFERPDGPPTIVTISRLEDPYKGHDVVLRALVRVREQLPTARWRVIGDGSLRPGLEEQARALGVWDAVEFLGAIDDEARDRELRSAHAFCMVSRIPAGSGAGEGFGIVYLEAGAQGLPVLAGRVGGALDAVVDGETGLLVDPEDHVAVAEALIRLLRDRDLARHLARGGRARAEQLTWALAGQKVEQELIGLIR